MQYHLQNTGGSPAQGKCETVGRGSNCFSPVKEMLSMAGAYVETAHTSAQVRAHVYYKKDIKSHICTQNYTRIILQSGHEICFFSGSDFW